MTLNSESPPVTRLIETKQIVMKGIMLFFVILGMILFSCTQDKKEEYREGKVVL